MKTKYQRPFWEKSLQHYSLPSLLKLVPGFFTSGVKPEPKVNKTVTRKTLKDRVRSHLARLSRRANRRNSKLEKRRTG